MKTISDLYEYTVIGNQNLLFSNTDLEGIENTSWLHVYKDNATAYDVTIDFLYGERIMLSKRLHETDSIETFLDSLRLYWKSYCETHMIQFQKAYDTLMLEYNPIWNVDGTETTEYSTHNITNNYSTHDIETPTPTITTKHNSFQDTDASNMVVDSETSGTTIVTSDKEHTDTTTDNEHNVTITKQGNIGVTSTQNLIKQELELRTKDFLLKKINDFMNTFTCWG